MLRPYTARRLTVSGCTHVGPESRVRPNTRRIARLCKSLISQLIADDTPVASLLP